MGTVAERSATVDWDAWNGRHVQSIMIGNPHASDGLAFEIRLVRGGVGSRLPSLGIVEIEDDGTTCIFETQVQLDRREPDAWDSEKAEFVAALRTHARDYDFQREPSRVLMGFEYVDVVTDGDDVVVTHLDNGQQRRVALTRKEALLLAKLVETPVEVLWELRSGRERVAFLASISMREKL